MWIVENGTADYELLLCILRVVRAYSLQSMHTLIMHTS